VAGPAEISAKSVRAKNIRSAAAQILSHVLLCSKVQQLYGGDNDNVRNAYETLLHKLEEFFKFERAFRLHLEEGYLFVNEVRCRVERATAEAHYWFLERFAESGLSAIVIEPDVSIIELRKLVPILARATWRDGEAPPPIADDLRAAYVVNVRATMRRTREIRADDTGQVEVSSQRLAAAFWLRLHRAATEAIEAARTGGTLSVRKVRSVLQLVIDAFVEDETPLLAMTRVRSYAQAEAPAQTRWTRYLPSHLANTAILSIGLGNRLGLDRRQLLELGTAAMFADVGMATVSEEALATPGPLPEDVRVDVEKHPLRGAELILASDGGARTSRVIAAAVSRHHLRVEAGEDIRPPLIPAIIAVGDTYDAMTSDRPWRRAHSHARAIRELVSGQSGHSPLLARVFANLLGLFPIGTAVELSTGEVALVTEQSKSMRLAARPRVKLLIDGSGKPSSGGIIDLAERGADGGFLRTVRRNLDMGIGEGGPAEIVSLL
jgi:HD-GYP domain-containing protein (c-di-GMP phosphodiesterase class II)